MNEKKCSKLLNDSVSDKYIDEAASAEKFFASRKFALLRKKTFLKMLSIVTACALIVVSLSIGVMSLIPQTEEPDKDHDSDYFIDGIGDGKNDDENEPSNDGGFWGDDDDDYYGGDDDYWGDDDTDGDSTDECIECVDENEDLLCDVCGREVETPWNPWDEVGYFTVPSSKVTVSNIIIADRLGAFTSSNKTFTSGSNTSIAEITNVKLPSGTSMTFTYNYTAGNNSSLAGIIFGATGELSDQNYYSAYVHGGYAYIEKSIDGVRTVLASTNANVYSDMYIELVWNADGSVKMTVGDTTVNAVAEAPSGESKIGLRRLAERQIRKHQYYA